MERANALSLKKKIAKLNIFEEADSEAWRDCREVDKRLSRRRKSVPNVIDFLDLRSTFFTVKYLYVVLQNRKILIYRMKCFK